jgi:hypothetical protein
MDERNTINWLRTIAAEAMQTNRVRGMQACKPRGETRAGTRLAGTPPSRHLATEKLQKDA